MYFKISGTIFFLALLLTACEQGGSTGTEPKNPPSLPTSGISMAISGGFDIPGDTVYDCEFNGSFISNGSSVTAYQNSTVDFGSGCVSESRLCTNGVLSGSYNYATCAVGAPAACLFDGRTLQDGESVTAYLNSTEAAGGSCSSETRVCSNGVLSGSFSFDSCSVGEPQSCLFNGAVVDHDSAVTAYLSPKVNFGETCVVESRVCIDGSLSGSNQYASCVVGEPSPCLFNGGTVANGESVTAFLNSSENYGGTCQSETRTCENGVLSGSNQYASCAVGEPASCLFNGETVAHGQTITAFAASSTSNNEFCQAESRTCDNGVLSGTFEFASCQINEPSSCLFNGQTIPDGGSVIAFDRSNVRCDQKCRSEVRVCSKGVLSGSFTYASCRDDQEENSGCSFNGLTLNEHQRIKAYKYSSGNCSPRETRVCVHGKLTGNFKYSSCNSGDTVHFQVEKCDMRLHEKKGGDGNSCQQKHKEHYDCGNHYGWYKNQSKR